MCDLKLIYCHYKDAVNTSGQVSGVHYNFNIRGTYSEKII